MDEMLRKMGTSRPPPVVEQRIIASSMEFVARPKRSYMAYWLCASGAVVATFVAVLMAYPKVTAVSPPPVDVVLQTSGETKRWSAAGHIIDQQVRSSIRFDSVGQGSVVLTVLDGDVSIGVAALASDAHFVVNTPQVRFEVLGTAFTVAVDERCSVVDLSEGQLAATVTGSGAQSVLRAPTEKSFCREDQSDDPVEQVDDNGDDGAALVRSAMALLIGGEQLPEAERLLQEYQQKYPGGLYEQEALFHLCAIKLKLGDRSEAQRIADDFFQRFPESRRSKRLREMLQR